MKIINMIKVFFLTGDERSSRARKNSLRMLINKGLSILLSLCFLPLFLSCFDKIEYGIWVTILSIINWFGFFDIGLGQGLRNKLTEAIANNNYKLGKEYISTTYFFVSLIFISIIIIFFIIYPFIDWYQFINAPSYLANDVNILFLIAFTSTLLTFILRNILFVLYAIQKPSLVSDINLLIQISTLVSVYIAIHFFHISSLIPFVIIMTGIPIIIYILYSAWLFKFKIPELSPSSKSIKLCHTDSLFKLGLLFFFIQIANIVIIHSNNFLISKVLGPQDVGEYQITFQYFSILTSVFYILTTPYWSAVTDAFTRSDFKWIEKAVKDLNKYYLLIVFCAIIMVLFSNPIFKIWIGDKITIRPLIVILMAIYVLIQSFGNIYISIINGIGNIKIQFYITLFAACIYIPIALKMIEYYNIYGLLFTMIIISVITTVWAPLQYKYLLKRTRNENQ